ncbi:cell envelope integrity protein TolA [Vibrio sp. Of7-15]|uniref:cell envelope integrity protein TolA n=1 Tax=Vibrio sp. Of7-15 TaxID=2724879 RepID=UPI001EF3A1C5|nr:cell envelope integrity protein TolA [Vibrio sp. Of7-15]MCG7496001.1 cell envelope integrity protein TolA [Vibrio sp. Of7-15]
MKNKNNYTVAILVSVTLHALLVAALLWGSDFSMLKKPPAGSTIQAVVIDPAVIEQQAKRIRQQRDEAKNAEQDRLERLRKQAEELEKNRQQEEARIRKLKADQVKAEKAAREAEKKRLDKEREQKKAAEKARLEKERAAKAEKERLAKQKAAEIAAEKAREEKERLAKAEAVRKAKELEAKKAEEQARLEKERAAKAEAERVAKEKAAKAAAEKARKEKERLEALRREREEKEAALNDIFAGLESETQQNSSAKQRFISDEKQRFGAIYTQMINRNYLRDDSDIGKECRVKIKLSNSGLLLDVTADGGDPVVCRKAKSAVTKVSTFPMSDDPDIAKELKNISLTVRPE